MTPDYDELVKRARRLLRSGDHQGSIDMFERARLLDDQQFELHEGLGTAHFLAGNCDSAVIHFKRVTELNPRRGAAFINLGAVYNRMENYSKAVEALRRGIQMEKRSAEGYYNLGIAYRRLKQPALAIPAYREAIRLDPKLAEAYQNIGNVYLDMGNLQQAIMHFKKALEVRPDFERARQGLVAAENAVLAAKESANPMGRLVEKLATSAVEESNGSGLLQRRLSPEERLHDRVVVQSLLKEIRTGGDALLEHLHKELEPTIRSMNRTSLQNDPADSDLEGAREKLRPIVIRYRSLCRSLRNAMTELRSHDARMNRPR